MDAYQISPLNPFEMRGDRPEMAIVAAGLPSNYLFYTDDKDTVSDDALREHLKKITLNWQDPEEIFFRSKANGFIRKTLPEQGPVVLSSVVTFLARRHPEVVIPLMAARAIINGKTFLHSMVLDRFGHRIPYLSDAERFAYLKRKTKPWFERTDDDELQDSVVLLSAPEAEDWLATNRGMTRESLALVDEDHATGKDIWKDKDRQEEILSKSVQKVYGIRQELSPVLGEELTAQNVDEFIEDLAKYLGSVRIFGVGRTPIIPTVSAVTKNIPILHNFVSKNVSDVVDRTVRAEWDKQSSSRTY